MPAAPSPTADASRLVPGAPAQRASSRRFDAAPPDPAACPLAERPSLEPRSPGRRPNARAARIDQQTPSAIRALDPAAADALPPTERTRSAAAQTPPARAQTPPAIERTPSASLATLRRAPATASRRAPTPLATAPTPHADHPTTLARDATTLSPGATALSLGATALESGAAILAHGATARRNNPPAPVTPATNLRDGATILPRRATPRTAPSHPERSAVAIIPACVRSPTRTADPAGWPRRRRGGSSRGCRASWSSGSHARAASAPGGCHIRLRGRGWRSCGGTRGRSHAC